MTLIYRKGETKPYKRSKNLRGLIEHARHVEPCGVYLSRYYYDETRKEWPYMLRVTFANGDTAESGFSDPIVAARFIMSRESWPPVAVYGLDEFVKAFD